MIKHLLSIVIVVVAKLFAFECYYNEIHDTIFKEIGAYQEQVANDSVFKYCNLFYPRCSEIKDKAKQIDVLKKYSTPWSRRCLKRYDHEQFLIGMKNGDDWIIGWQKINGMYVQFIDSRTLTILIRFDNKNKIKIDSPHLFKDIYAELCKVIYFPALSLDENANIKPMSKDSVWLKGYFVNAYKDIKEFKKDYVWTNGRYVILEITKIGYPYKSIKGELYQPRLIIDAIPLNDDRPFTRFRDSGNIDMRVEMLKVFPWMVDSINYYKRLPQKEIHGKTPEYMIKK